MRPDVYCDVTLWRRQSLNSDAGYEAIYLFMQMVWFSSNDRICNVGLHYLGLHDVSFNRQMSGHSLHHHQACLKRQAAASAARLDAQHISCLRCIALLMIFPRRNV